MKNLKQILVLLLPAALAAGSMSAGEIRTFNHQGDDYTVETRWINKQANNDYYIQKYDNEAWGYSPFFFVKNDLIYFTKDLSVAPSTNLLVVDGKTGNYKTVYQIDWGSFDHNEVAAVYCGIDSEGTYYVASYGTSQFSGYPFKIYPLQFSAEGVPTVRGYYELEMNNDCWIKSVDVYGSLLSGNFSVAASFWNSREIESNQDLKTGICVWNYSQGQAVNKKAFNDKITIADIKLVSEDKIAIHDRHLLKYTHPGYTTDYGENAIAKNPTLYTIEESSLNLQSEIKPATGDDGLGNGMAFFSLGEDNHFMVYASSGNPVEFKLMSLPNYPESLESAQELCTITPGSEGLSTITDYDGFSIRHKTGVFVEKIDDNTANIYVAGHNRGMASYTIKREEPLNTGIDDIISDDNEAAEYYTVTGLRLSDKPASGFYIEKKGGKATKKFIK